MFYRDAQRQDKGRATKRPFERRNMFIEVVNKHQCKCHNS